MLYYTHTHTEVGTTHLTLYCSSLILELLASQYHRFPEGQGSSDLLWLFSHTLKVNLKFNRGLNRGPHGEGKAYDITTQCVWLIQDESGFEWLLSTSCPLWGQGLQQWPPEAKEGKPKLTKHPPNTSSSATLQGRYFTGQETQNHPVNR